MEIPRNPILNLVCLGFLGVELIANVSCATSSSFDQYSRTKIDRPWTLPKGMTEAQVALPWNYPKSTLRYDVAQPIPLKVYWTHALSDDFSFIWFVLPLGLKYQLLKSKTHSLGIEFYNHLGDPEDPTMSPYLQLKDLFRVNSQFAIETAWGTQALFQFKKGNTVWTHALSMGPRWQAHPLVSLYLWIGALQGDEVGAVGWSLPTGLELQWSVIRQWDVVIRSSHRWLAGSTNPDQNLTATLLVNHFW